jgi:hypothetical protein
MSLLDMTNPQVAKAHRVSTLRAAVALECKGMKLSRGVSAYATAKREFNLRGNKANVLKQLEKMRDECLAGFEGKAHEIYEGH